MRVLAELSRQVRAPAGSLGLALFLALCACKLGPVHAPYDDGEAPSAEALMTAREAPLSAVRVGRAKIRERSLSATLMYVVQGPQRFAGTIQIAGNELVSLAVNERAYHLRLKSDRAGRPGYHEGPPSACAVERLVGIAIEPNDLVALLLGGAPLAVAPTDAGVVAQQWNKRWPGREELDLEWPGGKQRLRFAWVGDAWRFAGTEVWARVGDELVWRWSVDHTAFHRVDGAWLPEQTVIETPRPGSDLARGKTPRTRRKRRQQTQALTIAYLEQQPDPPDLLAGESGADEGGDDGGWVDTWDDDWDDDGSTDQSAEGSDAAPPAPAPKAEPIPAAFILDATGLPARGDLCADAG